MLVPNLGTNVKDRKTINVCIFVSLGLALEGIILIATIGSIAVILPCYWCFKQYRKPEEPRPEEAPAEASSSSVRIPMEVSNADLPVAQRDSDDGQPRVNRPAPERNVAHWERKVNNVSQNGYGDVGERRSQGRRR